MNKWDKMVYTPLKNQIMISKEENGETSIDFIENISKLKLEGRFLVENNNVGGMVFEPIEICNGKQIEIKTKGSKAEIKVG